MAQPTIGSVHADRPLTMMSQGIIQSQTNFIASKVFPTVPVSKKSDSYYIYTQGDWFRDEAAIRPPATESAGSGWTLSTTTYNCDVYAIHKDLDDQTLANADDVLNMEQDAVEFVTQRQLLKHEIEWTAAFFGTGLWGTSATPSNLWDVYATSAPLTDVQTGIKTVLSNTGFKPNTGVLGYDVWSAMLNHPDIIERIKYTSSSVPTEQIIGNYFGLDRIFVASAVKNTATEGATASYSFVQGKHMWLGYVAPRVGPRTPTAGVTFAWTGVSDGMGATIGTSRFDIPQLKVTRIESQMAWDSKIVGTALGYTLVSVVS